MKIEWMPTYNSTVMNVGSDDNTKIVNMFMASSLTDKNLNTKNNANLAMLPGFKSLNPYRPWKRYISSKKISHQQNVKWQLSKLTAPGVANGLTDATTLVRFNLTDVPDGE